MRHVLTYFHSVQVMAANEVGPQCQAIGPMATQRIASALRWAAKRTSAATTSLMIQFALDEVYASSAAIATVDTLVAAISGVAQLSHLRSLVFLAYTFEEGGIDYKLVSLLDYLLAQAPRLETAYLGGRTGHIPASHITFQHMRHLVMPAHGFQSHLRVAEQLPALEVLSVVRDEHYDIDLEVIDMSGCTRLRQLVLSDYIAEELIWDTSRLGPCPLTFQLQKYFENLEGVSPEAVYNQAALAQQVYLSYHEHSDQHRQGLLALFSQMKLLVLDSDWPPGYEPEWADGDDSESDSREEAGDFLSRCMPANGQPLQNLEAIIIQAFSMQMDFPSAEQLPNLRELVIKASGRLEIGFQDAVGTIARLSSLHVLGQPLVPRGSDMLKLMAASDALGERGLVLSAVVTEQHEPHGRPTSGMYLRPVGVRKLSLDELCTKVEQLAQCRCGACLGCWERAGYIGTF